MFNVLCSACFSIEWIIPNVWLVSKSISRLKHLWRHKHTHSQTHAPTQTHTCICTVRWNTLRKIQAVWLLNVWLIDFSFCCHYLIPVQTALARFHPSVPHKDTHTHILSTGAFWCTDSPELITTHQSSERENHAAHGSGQHCHLTNHTHWSPWSISVLLLPPAWPGQGGKQGQRWWWLWWWQWSCKCVCNGCIQFMCTSIKPIPSPSIIQHTAL